MLNTKDISLYVYITFYYNDKSPKDQKKARLRYLAELLLQLSYISVKNLHIKIFTNYSQNSISNATKPIKARNTVNCTSEIFEISNDSLLNDEGVFEPHLLTWAHKNELFRDVSNAQVQSYFLYLEDDALFTEANLSYFIEHRAKLRSHGLIPSFLRAEWNDNNGEWINSDSFERLPKISDSSLQIDADSKYIEVKNPYCAMILLDLELAKEYVASESSKLKSARHKHYFIWDSAATAALGLISEKIPKGYSSRTVVGFGSQSLLPLIGSIVRHQGDRYANEIWWRHFRLFEDHSKGDLPIPKRSFLQKIKRIYKDPKLLKAINRTSHKH
jgi:hypothetical protein